MKRLSICWIIGCLLVKHELISVQIKLENAEKELAKMKEENNDLQMQIVKLETEMKNRRK